MQGLKIFESVIVVSFDFNRKDPFPATHMVRVTQQDTYAEQNEKNMGIRTLPP